MTRNTSNSLEATSLKIDTSIQLIQLQFLQKSTSNVKTKVMIWMGMSSKGASDHKSKQALNQETYLKECIDKRLLLQVSFEWK